MIRQINEITYILTQKNVKNINLRVKEDGIVAVSAHKKVPLTRIDDFVASKEQWIKQVQGKIQNKVIENCNYTDEECLSVFEKISDKIYPCFQKYLPEKPLIKVKEMKSCWGVCHTKKCYITLNKRLMLKPVEAIEYVIMHEYVHFLEPNHQEGFHKIMKQVMDDYKQRKSLLTTAYKRQ